MQPIRIFLSILAVLLGGLSVLAQDVRYPRAKTIDRETVQGADGKVEWKEWKAEDCKTCKGTGKTACLTCSRFIDEIKTCGECGRKDDKKESACRVCAGKGKRADPLKELLCPGCRGVGKLMCVTCSGSGVQRLGGAKRWSACVSCRGTGGVKCDCCGGKRLVSSLDLKPSLAEAPLDKLQKAKEVVSETLAGLEKFKPVGGAKKRKQLKELEKLVAEPKKLHPAFKKLPKLVKNYVSKVFAGANIQGSEEREQNAMNLVKDNVSYYLEIQQRMLDAAIKRAEANEKAGK